MAYQVKQGQSTQPLMFLLVQSADHISPLTGASPTITLSKNGGSFAGPAGAVSEVGSGWYKVAPNATDCSTLGPLILHAVAASGDPCDVTFPVVAFDPLATPSVPPSAALIATAVWTDATPSDFTTANSPGAAMASLNGMFLVGAVLSVSGNQVVTVQFASPTIASNIPVGCYCCFLAGTASPSKISVSQATQGLTSSQVVLTLASAWATAPTPGNPVSVG